MCQLKYVIGTENTEFYRKSVKFSVVLNVKSKCLNNITYKREFLSILIYSVFNNYL